MKVKVQWVALPHSLGVYEGDLLLSNMMSELIKMISGGREGETERRRERKMERGRERERESMQ